MIIRGLVSFTCLFSGYCLKFGVLVPGWNLLLLGHLSWLFLATPQPKLSSAVDWPISPTVVLKIVYLLSRKQSLDQLSLTNACCLLPAFMDCSQHQPALLLGNWGLWMTQKCWLPLENPCIHGSCRKGIRTYLSWLRALCYFQKKKGKTRGISP